MKTVTKTIAALSVSAITALTLYTRLSSDTEPQGDLQSHLKSSPTGSSSTKDLLAVQQSASSQSREKLHPGSCACAGCDSGTASGSIDQKQRPALQLTAAIQQTLFNASKDSTLSFALPGNSAAQGTVEMTRQEKGETVMVQGTLSAPQAGHFFFQKQSMPGVAGAMVGAVVFDEGDISYTVSPAADGSPELREAHTDNVICRSFVPQVEEAPSPELILDDHPSNTPIPSYQNGVVALSSLPGATAVAYLDFDGEKGPFASWGGGTYDALPANTGNANVRDVWKRVAEDFAPFNINVTTDLQVYLDAPENSRIRCIISPTNTARPGAGGVAFVGSFNWTGDVVCWVFQVWGKYCAEAASHEIGHTLGLSHDGRTTPSEGYYSGHNGWAPIMGVGYYANLSQWSKGEYLNANQKQDDLVRINNNNNVDYRTDDHGDSFVNASYLEILSDDTVDSEGVIQTSADEDSMRFTLTQSSTVALAVNAGATGPNLDIRAELLDSSGSVISVSGPTDSLNATISSTLPAGDYALRISGVGKGDPLGDGYTDYASMGYYKVTGTVPNALAPDRFTVAENAAVATSVGTPTPNNPHAADTLTFSFASGNESGAFAIDPATGALTVADSSQLDFEAAFAFYDNPASYELFVAVSNAARPELDETVRIVVTITDVNEAPTLSTPAETPYLGRPSLDGYSIFSVTSSDPDLGQLPVYTITAGNSDNAFAINSATGEVTVADSAAFNASSESSYSLTIQVSDGQSPALTSTATVEVQAFAIPAGVIPGSLSQKYYRNINGILISDLTSDPDFPASPDNVKTLNEFTTSGYGDNFGSTISGVIFVPVSGDYTFWIASDDAGELRLSSDASAANTATIATVAEWSGFQAWDQSPSQQSSPVSLVAGQAYYIEALYKEGGGGDHCSVAWQGPGISRQVIGSQFIALSGSAPEAVDNSGTLAEDAAVGSSVATISFTDADPDDTHSFSITGGNTGNAFTIDSSGNITTATALNYEEASSYSLIISVLDFPGGHVATATCTVTVTDANDAPTISAPEETPYLGRPSTNGSSLFSVTSSDPDLGQLPAYTITAGNDSNQFAIDSATGEVTVANSAAINASSQSTYNLTIQVSDGQSPALTDSIVVAIQTFALPYGYTPGTLNQKYYENINGILLNNLTSNPAFPDAPDRVTSLTEFSTSGYGDNFGSTISGVILVPVSGEYTFWIASDDQGELRLSTDHSPSNSVVIATVAAYSGFQEWNKSPSQQSSTINLKAGQAYAIEARYKEGGGGDHCAVAWQGPAFARQVIGSQFIAPALPLAIDSDDDTLDDSWEVTHYGSLGAIDATADTDGDGYTAFQEMVFGMNPTRNNPSSAPQRSRVVDDNGTEKMEFKFRRPQNWQTLNVTYQLQTGNDLVELNWADNAATGSTTIEEANEWVTFLLPLSDGAENKAFYRCVVKPMP